MGIPLFVHLKPQASRIKRRSPHRNIWQRSDSAHGKEHGKGHLMPTSSATSVSPCSSSFARRFLILLDGATGCTAKLVSVTRWVDGGEDLRSALSASSNPTLLPKVLLTGTSGRGAQRGRATQYGGVGQKWLPDASSHRLAQSRPCSKMTNDLT